MKQKNTNGPDPCVLLFRGIEKDTGIRSICVLLRHFVSLALDHIRRIGAHYGAYLPQD